MIFIQKNIKYIIIDAVHSQSGDADSWRNPSPFFHEIIFIKGVEPSSDNSFIEIYLENIKIILKWEKKAHSFSSCLHNCKAITCLMNRYLQPQLISQNVILKN